MWVLLYSGEFVSRAGRVWRANIMRNQDDIPEEVGALTFDVEPLTIEWGRKDKWEVVCGSSATLNIISPGDRTYVDLYSVEAGTVSLTIYRDEQLYWSGTLDPEFYEEPYERASNYTVSLTFTDFAILDRVEYDLNGLRQLDEIIAAAEGKMLLDGDTSIDVSRITTYTTDYNEILSGLLIRSDNFIDEDGKRASYMEVLEGILQPLALRIIQRNGAIRIYDLNGAYNAGGDTIQWGGDTQTLTVDRVAHSATITFSPYSSSELLEGKIDYRGQYDEDTINRSNNAINSQSYGDYYSYYSSYDPDFLLGNGLTPSSPASLSFTIFLHDEARGLASIGQGCKYFKTLPLLGGGSEASGVAYSFRTGGHDAIASGKPIWRLNGMPSTADNSLHNGKEVLTSERVYLPKVQSNYTHRNRVYKRTYNIRLVQEILFDCRYNPFNSGEHNESGNVKYVNEHANWVFIYAKVQLYCNGGAVYHYKNKSSSNDAFEGVISLSRGTWVQGTDPGGDCVLAYYDPSDPKNSSGIGGWKKNRHYIGRPDGAGGRLTFKIHDTLKDADEGEYIPYPPEAGWVEVKVLAGFNAYDYGSTGTSIPYETATRLRWCLYKAPTIEVVRNNYTYSEEELDDVMHTGYINRHAKEELDIETICGSADRPCPTARGIFTNTSNHFQTTMITRGDRTDYPERLLLGTLISQYSRRHTVLTGEAYSNDEIVYTEANQGDKQFLLMSESQNVIADTSECEYCELSPEEYEPIEEEV